MTIKAGNTANAGETIEGYGRPLAQMASQCVNIQSGSWVNKNYLAADTFTETSGAKLTVDIGNTDCILDGVNNNYICSNNRIANTGSLYNPDSFLDTGSIYDDSDTTYGQKTVSVGGYSSQTVDFGYTFSPQYISAVNVNGYTQTFNGGVDTNTTGYIKLYTGSNGDWTEEVELVNEKFDSWTSTNTIEYNNSYLLNKVVSGLMLKFRLHVDDNDSHNLKARLYNFNYGDSYTSGNTLQTTEILSGTIPNSVLVYGNTDLPDGTSIYTKVSDDAGSNFTAGSYALNEYIDTSSFTGSALALQFNLNTNNGSITPKLYGYGVTITDV